jgi:hypothetical protein
MENNLTSHGGNPKIFYNDNTERVHEKVHELLWVIEDTQGVPYVVEMWSEVSGYKKFNVPVRDRGLYTRIAGRRVVTSEEAEAIMKAGVTESKRCEIYLRRLLSPDADTLFGTEKCVEYLLRSPECGYDRLIQEIGKILDKLPLDIADADENHLRIKLRYIQSRHAELERIFARPDVPTNSQY